MELKSPGFSTALVYVCSAHARATIEGEGQNKIRPSPSERGVVVETTGPPTR